MALELELLTPDWVQRVPTDDRSDQDTAGDLLPHTGWTDRVVAGEVNERR
ncbi:hypothetical protein [Arthrobacter sp. B2a2-09]|nr:hypothetical protein [Arthrobacter sp. B2a2-09]